MPAPFPFFLTCFFDGEARFFDGVGDRDGGGVEDDSNDDGALRLPAKTGLRAVAFLTIADVPCGSTATADTAAADTIAVAAADTAAVVAAAAAAAGASAAASDMDSCDVAAAPSPLRTVAAFAAVITAFAASG